MRQKTCLAMGLFYFCSLQESTKLEFFQKRIMDNNFKSVVKNSYLALIQGSLSRILLLENDSLLNYLIRVHLSTPENADEVLLITDKFYIYRLLWKAVLETLYENFLPKSNYKFTWNIEITPYTLLLCEITKERIPEKELDFIKSCAGFSEVDIETNYEIVAEKIGLSKIGLAGILEKQLPKDLYPASRRGQLLLLFKLMNFPPLEELSLFVARYTVNNKSQFKDLSQTFSWNHRIDMPEIGMMEPLHYSYFHIDHECFKKHGIEGFEKNVDLQEFKAEFHEIEERASSLKSNFTDEIICPCCGKRHVIELPEEILQYKYILENKKLSKAIGLQYFRDFSENFRSVLSEKFHGFLSTINRVDEPKCMILVEGDSEEVALPILAFRKRFILSHNGTQVYNSKSKQKLKEDFFIFKERYPSKKIVCLLDSDAEKERDDILRAIKDKKNKYRLVFINQGTFEDIFDLDLSVDILNKLYPEGELITTEDFSTAGEFLPQIKKLLHFKKKAQFDKVLFAKSISMQVDTTKIPAEIEEIFKIVKDFTKEYKFVSSK